MQRENKVIIIFSLYWLKSLTLICFSVPFLGKFANETVKFAFWLVKSSRLSSRGGQMRKLTKNSLLDPRAFLENVHQNNVRSPSHLCAVIMIYCTVILREAG